MVPRVKCNSLRYDGHIFYRISTAVPIPKIKADFVEVYVSPTSSKQQPASTIMDVECAIRRLYLSSRVLFVDTSCKEYLTSPQTSNFDAHHPAIKFDSQAVQSEVPPYQSYWCHVIAELLSLHDITNIRIEEMRNKEMQKLRIRAVEATTQSTLSCILKDSSFAAWPEQVTHYEIFPHVYTWLVKDICTKMNQAPSLSQLQYNLWMCTGVDPPDCISQDTNLARMLLNTLADSNSAACKLLLACDRWRERFVQQQKEASEPLPLLPLPRSDESASEFFDRIDHSPDLTPRMQDRILGIVGLLQSLAL